jgi:hypothetical protein
VVVVVVLFFAMSPPCVKLQKNTQKLASLLRFIIAFAKSAGQYADRESMRRLLLATIVLFVLDTGALFAIDPIDRLMRSQRFSDTIGQIQNGTIQSVLPSAAIARSILASEGVFRTAERDQLLLALLLHAPDGHEAALVDTIFPRVPAINDWALLHALLETAVTVSSPDALHLADLLIDRYIASAPGESEAKGAVPALLAAIEQIEVRRTPTTVEILRTVASRSTDGRLVRRARAIARSLFASSN